MKTLVLVYYGFVICGRMVSHILAVVEIEAKLLFLPSSFQESIGPGTKTLCSWLFTVAYSRMVGLVF